MSKKSLITIIAMATASFTHAELQSLELTVGDGFVDPIGFHDATPTFSWKLPVGVQTQTAYRIEVKDTSVLWDSGWVESDQSVYVPYGGKPLKSRQQVTWRVSFKDENGKDSGWSDTATFELGLLSQSDWKAQWIRFPETPLDVEKVTAFKRAFEIDGAVEHARLYVTARGVYEMVLNGEKVGDDHFANGFTSYANRLDSLTYDITDQLKEGSNSVGALLGYGWYAGRFGWQGQRNVFGEYPELLVQLEIVYKDGRKQQVVSDKNWKATLDGPLLWSSIYDGEHFDANKVWTDWGPVATEKDLGAGAIVPKPFAAVKKTETIPVREIVEVDGNRVIFDLGQNMVGWAKLNIPVQKGETVTIRFAEMLNPDGSVHTENYRGAKSIDFYTASETGMIEWEPTFTFHGFRYVELSGMAKGAKPDKGWVTGVVLHTEMEKVGTFESSHAKLNQLQRNITWGQRGNFLDIPTDCPQRDERAGWTGDAQVFISTAMFNYDSRAFWKSWLASMRDDQLENGNIPHVVPDILEKGGSPGWVDAATIIPWQFYVRTGDAEVLAENYQMMERLVGWYRGRTKDGLIPKIKGFGDWLQPHTDDQRGDTPHALLALAFYANSCQILADSARVLGRDADTRKYDAEAKSIRESFTNHYFDAQGKLQNAPETQTAYLLAIAFELIPESMREPAAVNLARLVEEADGHLRTGFLGTPFIVRVLDDMGRSDLALTVLFKESYPSWFYSINQGATTMWERWNSYTIKDGFSGDKMNSLNHYAYGAIGEWMYERLAGLSPDVQQPGYKHFFVRPIIVDQLEWVRADLDTAYGIASSGWRKEGGKLVLEGIVPPNTTATIVFPNDRDSERVTAGSFRYELEL